MDKQVEDFVRSCYPCQLVGPRGKPEPLRPSELPEAPWQEIRIDLLTNFEPHPYKVVRRDENAVVVEDTNGNNRMRGIAHMKKYIEQEGNQQNPNPVESPDSDVKIPTADASSQDISSQSKHWRRQNDN